MVFQQIVKFAMETVKIVKLNVKHVKIHSIRIALKNGNKKLIKITIKIVQFAVKHYLFKSIL